MADATVEISESSRKFLLIAGGCVLLGTVVFVVQVYRCIAAAFYNPEVAEEKARAAKEAKKKTSTKKKPEKKPKAAAREAPSSSDDDEPVKPLKPAPSKPGVSLKALKKAGAQAAKKGAEGPDKLSGHQLFLNALKGHTETINSIAWSTDSRSLATACEDRYVRVFNFHANDITANPDQKKFQHRWFPVGIAWGGKRELGVVTHALLEVANLEIYDADRLADGPGKTLEKIHGKDSIIGIASSVTSGGSTPLMVTCTKKKHAKVMDFMGRELASPAPNAFDNYMATISRDGRFIAAGTFTSDVKIWEVCFSRDGLFTGCPKVMQLGHKGAILAVGFSPDASKAVTASRDGFLRVWNIAVRYKQSEDAKCLLQITLPVPKKGDCYTRLAWSPCGKVIAAIVGGEVHFLDPKTGELLEAVRGIHDTHITDVQWSPSPVGTPSGSAHVLAVSSANRVRILSAP